MNPSKYTVKKVSVILEYKLLAAWNPPPPKKKIKKKKSWIYQIEV